MAEQIGDRFPIVNSPDGFCKDHGGRDHLYFDAMLHVILQRYGIGDFYCFKARVVNVRNGWTRKDSVSQHNINRAPGEKFISWVARCTTGVSHVIHEEGHPGLHIARQRRAVHFDGLPPFSVNHSKVLSPLSEVKVTLLAPPASGETVTEFLPLDVFSLIHLRTADSANKFPSGVKNLRSMQVPGDTMTLVYYRDHFATSLAKIGAQLLAFLFFQT